MSAVSAARNRRASWALKMLSPGSAAGTFRGRLRAFARAPRGDRRAGLVPSTSPPGCFISAVLLCVAEILLDRADLVVDIGLQLRDRALQALPRRALRSPSGAASPPWPKAACAARARARAPFPAAIAGPSPRARQARRPRRHRQRRATPRRSQQFGDLVPVLLFHQADSRIAQRTPRRFAGGRAAGYLPDRRVHVSTPGHLFTVRRPDFRRSESSIGWACLTKCRNRLTGKSFPSDRTMAVKSTGKSGPEASITRSHRG